MNLKTGGRGDPPPHDNVLTRFSLGAVLISGQVLTI